MSPELATVSVLLWAAAIAVYVVPHMKEGNIFERIFVRITDAMNSVGRMVMRRGHNAG